MFSHFDTKPNCFRRTDGQSKGHRFAMINKNTWHHYVEMSRVILLRDAAVSRQQWYKISVRLSVCP